MMEEMGGQGEFVYFNFGKNGFIQDIIDAVLAEYPQVKATSMPAEHGKQAFTQESLVEMVKKEPRISKPSGAPIIKWRSSGQCMAHMS